jgi:hypothetical protein
MNPQTATIIANSDSVLLHCHHRTASGRRCRMAISDPHSGLCRKHAVDRQKELEEADLAAILIGDIQEFRDAVTINHSLGELYKLLAKNKITPRRGAVMAYTANLLLRTLPAIAYESNLEAGTIPRPGQRRPDRDDEPRIIIDMPRPDRD